MTQLYLLVATTTPNDRNVGITVIDLGYNSSRTIIFKDGIPKLFYSFPMELNIY